MILVMCVFSLFLFFFLLVLLEVCSFYWSFREPAFCFIYFLHWFSVSNFNHVSFSWCLISGAPPPPEQARLELDHGNREGVWGGKCFHPSVWRAADGRGGDVPGNSRGHGEGIPADPACSLCFWLHAAWRGELEVEGAGTGEHISRRPHNAVRKNGKGKLRPCRPPCLRTQPRPLFQHPLDSSGCSSLHLRNLAQEDFSWKCLCLGTQTAFLGPRVCSFFFFFL